MTPKAQRDAMRLDQNVREQLPTLAHVLDLLHYHEQSRESVRKWLHAYADEYELDARMRTLEGYDALDAWLRDEG
jgi:hypothetical protein